MKFKPLLFSTPMVEATLAGTKTQTRRIVKPQPNEQLIFNYRKKTWQDNFAIDYKAKANIGDIFWVREIHYAYGKWEKSGSTKTGRQKWTFKDFTFDGHTYCHAENPPEEILKTRESGFGWYKRNSFFMPKQACRLFLKVKNVRIEKLHDITPEDAKAEGIDIIDDYWGEFGARNYARGEKEAFRKEYFFAEDPHGMQPLPSHNGYQASFFTLWWSINGIESLKSNPYVFVYDYEIVDQPEGFLN